ncbi:hypothetical protein Ciccas_009589 [Cichlidogyrus casuarinus]|uniref:CRAL-TRIO domain-containing protein n=1 Tax=Cichlidogyrus casuarinus TaxID=1844966 RepID=A0ABD2PY15_9PLAT
MTKRKFDPALHLVVSLLRYLRSRDLKLSDAEKMIKSSIEWRRKMRPPTVTCETCLSHPGAHSFRMVGFDSYRRPVLYSSFNQASKLNVSAEDVNQHLIYTMENAIKTMVPGVYQWIIIFDCSGQHLAISLIYRSLHSFTTPNTNNAKPSSPYSYSGHALIFASSSKTSTPIG